MLSAERVLKIAEIVNKNGGIKTSDLSNMFDVSEMTVLRDLAALEKKGLLKRVYGGAISTKVKGNEVSSFIREKLHPEEKNTIAELAAGIIEEGDQIFIDPSTTCAALAKKMKNLQDITVVTNSLEVINELTDNEKIKILCPGGDFKKLSMSFSGPITELVLKDMYFDKIFFSPSGCSLDHGITEPNIYGIAAKRSILDNSKETILMSDLSKFDTVSYYKLCSWDKINTVITEKKPDERYMEFFNENNIRIIYGS